MSQTDLEQYATLFNTIEKQALTQSQRQACVSKAQNTLVLAGAGTGKTSTLIARLAYLIQSQQAKPEEVLLLAFAVEAAQEIQQRSSQLSIDSREKRDGVEALRAQSSSNDVTPNTPSLSLAQAGFRARTFHSLGLHIINQVRDTPVSLALWTQEQGLVDFIQEQFFALCREPFYKMLLFDYFSYYESNLKDGEVPLSYRSLADDFVAHPYHLLMANVLYCMGVKYVYQGHYEHDIDLIPYHPYRADFVLPEYGLYVQVYDVKEIQLSNEQQQLRTQIHHIHQRHQSHCVEFYGGSSASDFVRKVIEWVSRCQCQSAHPLVGQSQTELMVGKFEFKLRSKGRLQPLLKQLHETLLLLKMQDYSSDTSIEGAQQDSADESVALSDAGQNLLALCRPIIERYQTRLAQEQAIDFDAMIQQASEHVSQGHFVVPWSDILIDEFQDISAARFELILAMRKQKPSLRLFCVGDDWQAIYAFAGSLVRCISHFEEYVGSTERYILEQTFRFNSALCEVSSEFIMRNPAQTCKVLSAERQQQKPAISLLADLSSMGLVFDAILDQHYQTSLAQAQWSQRLWDYIAWVRTDTAHESRVDTVSVLILARFKHLLPDTLTLNQWQSAYPQLNIRASTIHSAKGKEADYVIVLAVDAGEYGLPSEKQSHSLFCRWQKDVEHYPHAQERRVFYVAISRARQHVYLCYNSHHPSSFIEELEQQGERIQWGLKSALSEPTHLRLAGLLKRRVR